MNNQSKCSSMSSTSPPTKSSTSPPKHRQKVKYPKVFGYLLDPIEIYEQAIKDGTVTTGLNGFGHAVGGYRQRLAKHCGIKYNDIITIHNPKPDTPPAYCVVAANNLSKRSKIPRTDIIEKAKGILPPFSSNGSLALGTTNGCFHTYSNVQLRTVAAEVRGTNTV